ncbi:TIGR03545 family protein [Alteromonas pelagimontana]|uniref:TIGR03545 family protein n=1 Tax=Alteromonas pelagimontana TaxID=1858656 RepID=A0A6M4ME25_9ALTE|nr:TIGR03545 family protein [Alteromonas pelagimontana]QJR80406.1 TIGR03545 family protein [Alteromonas pelagimontana]
MSKSKGFRKRYIALLFLVLIIVAYLLFANPIIKGILESKLSEAYGAQVDIGEFDHSLFPVGVQLYDIGMTDAAQPDRNQVVIGTAKADVELLPLLSERIVITQLDMLDVKFDQARQTPGEVYRQPTHALSFEEIKNKAKEAIPTVDELLARSPLQTTAAVQQAQKVYSVYAEGLQNDYQTLPDQTRLNYYKDQIKQLQSINYKDPQVLLGAKETLDNLKVEMRQDREKITTFTAKAKDAKQALSESVAMLKQAPKEDYALLKGVVAGDQAALQQVTQFVFGEKAAEYTEYLMSAIQIVLPLIQGDDRAPQEAGGEMPSILVRLANVSVSWKDERINSVWKNITNTHPLVGEPTTFTISAAGQLLKQFESFGQFWIDDNGVDASQSWNLAGVDLTDIPFAKDEKLSAALQHALLNTSGSLSVTNDRLSGTGEINLTDLAMQATGTNNVTTAIANALASLTSLAMTMTLDGTVNNPGFRIKSDLDNKLAQSALMQLSASQQDKLNELTTKLNAMVANQQDAASSQLVDINKILNLAQSDSAALDELLKTQLSGVVNNQKEKLLEKLKKKINQS